MAVAQKTGIPKWVTLSSGNVDHNLPVCPSDRLILSHSHLAQVLSPGTLRRLGALENSLSGSYGPNFGTQTTNVLLLRSPFKL